MSFSKVGDGMVQYDYTAMSGQVILILDTQMFLRVEEKIINCGSVFI